MSGEAEAARRARYNRIRKERRLARARWVAGKQRVAARAGCSLEEADALMDALPFNVHTTWEDVEYALDAIEALGWKRTKKEGI